MRLTIIGGGGFRVPLVYGALRPGGLIDEVALYDDDPARLAAIGNVLAGQDGPRVTVAATLDEALIGAAYVFCAVRVGGTAGRITDERVALGLGVLGQETTGPGGLAYGLRTVPVMERIAERIAAVAPDAWTINFTNPVGMVTEAMTAALGDRVIGICDSPVGLFRRTAWLLGEPVGRVWFDYAGLNHLGWLTGASVGGRDRLPALLADRAALARIEEGRLFGPDRLSAMGLLPNEYLFYYYATREAIAAVADRGATRGEFLAQQQAGFYAEAATAAPREAYRLWQRTRAERDATYLPEAERGKAGQDEPEGGGYEQVALDVMAAIAGHAPATLVLNTRNRGALAGLDVDAVVELTCLVDANGAHPLAARPLPAHALALAAAVKAVDRLVIEAARTGSRETAVRAFALHPLVDSAAVAEQLVDGYAAGHPELAGFTRR